MNRKTYDTYIQILQNELVPALGCTEPIAIAYCSAKAREVLGDFPDTVRLMCSGNVIKNAMGVTVPNSGGLKGIEVASVLGIVAGDAERKLEVLNNVTENDIILTRELLKNKNFCTTSLVDGDNNLIIICEIQKNGNTALVEIKNKHTFITRIEKDSKLIFSQNVISSVSDELPDFTLLNVKDIIEFADTFNLEDVKDVLERQAKTNSDISQEGLKNSWGINIGKTLLAQSDNPSLQIQARAAASAGSDARMGGCAMPVIINSGSGNQGITLTMPIVVYARELGVSHELMLRSLALGNLIAIHQKQYIGDLSAYCGVVCAATGAASGIAYMLGDRLEGISNTITNTICTIGGMVCDGAKPSCAAKISIALAAALDSYVMQSQGGVFKIGEGLVKKDVENTIRSVGRMAKVGMNCTDKEIISIMLEK